VCTECVMSNACQRIDCKLSEIGSEEDRETSVKVRRTESEKVENLKEVGSLSSGQ